MKRKTFVLRNKKTFRRFVKIFLKSVDGKVDKRGILFTTEHLIQEKERTSTARKKAAEFSTNDALLIDGMYRDTGYGDRFVENDDPDGKKKLEAFNVKPLDVKRTALRNIFKEVGLSFDEDKSLDVLNEELSIYMAAQKGVEPSVSAPKEIKHEEVNLEAEMQDQVSSAISAYEEKYGEEMPSEYKSDKGFLSAILSDPKFDAKAYIASKELAEPEAEELPDNAEKLREIYLAELGANVANVKKNDVAWMQNKILAHREGK